MPPSTHPRTGQVHSVRPNMTRSHQHKAVSRLTSSGPRRTHPQSFSIVREPSLDAFSQSPHQPRLPRLTSMVPAAQALISSNTNHPSPPCVPSSCIHFASPRAKRAAQIAKCYPTPRPPRAAFFESFINCVVVCPRRTIALGVDDPSSCPRSC